MSPNSAAEHVSDRERMADAMLALAEDTLRACVEAGLCEALRARAERVLGVEAIKPLPAVLPTSEAVCGDGFDQHAGAMTYLELSRVLGCLKAARSSRLSPTEIAANILARGDVLRAMRTTGEKDIAA